MSRTTVELLLAVLLQTSRPVVGPPRLLWNRYRYSFLWVQRPRSEVNQLPVSIAEVKDQWSCTSTQLVCFLGVDKEKLGLYFSTSRVTTEVRCDFISLDSACGIGRCGGLTTRFHSYITVPVTEFDIHLAPFAF